MELNQTHEFASKIRRSIAAPVNQAANSDNLSAKTFDNINGLLNFRAPRNDIFGHDESLARQNLKSTSQDQFSILFLSEYMTLTEDSDQLLVRR